MEISEYNGIRDLQDYVASALNQSAFLQDLSVQFYAENRRDVEFQIKNALQRQGLACVVTTPNLQYIGHDGANCAWQAELQLLITEYTPINRAANKEKWASGLDIANYIAEYLGGPQGAVQFGKFCAKEIKQSEEQNLLATTITFDTTFIGQLSGEFDWDAENHDVVISPYASQSDLDELSGQVQDISAQISSITPFDPSVLSAYETKEDAAIEHAALSSAISAAVYDIEAQLTAYETKAEAEASRSELSGAISSAVQEIETVDDKLSAYLPLAGGRMTGPITGVNGRSSFADGFFAMSEDQYKRANLENGELLLTDEDAEVPYAATKNLMFQAGIGGEISSFYDIMEEKLGDIETILSAL